MALHAEGATEAANAFLKWLGVRTRALIDTHWEAVRRVAEALIVRKELGADEIKQLILSQGRMALR